MGERHAQIPRSTTPYRMAKQDSLHNFNDASAALSVCHCWNILWPYFQYDFARRSPLAHDPLLRLYAPSHYVFGRHGPWRIGDDIPRSQWRIRRLGFQAQWVPMKRDIRREEKLLSLWTVCRDYSQVINYLESVRAYDDQQIYWNWSTSIQLNLTQPPEISCWFCLTESWGPANRFTKCSTRPA